MKGYMHKCLQVSQAPIGMNGEMLDFLPMT